MDIGGEVDSKLQEIVRAPRPYLTDAEEALRVANKTAVKLRERSDTRCCGSTTMFLSVDAHIAILALCIAYRRMPATIRKAFAEMVYVQLQKEFYHENPTVRCGRLRIHVDL